MSRQRSSRDLPHTLCVEIAYSTDSSPPREHASPESFTERYKGEGYHAYPRSAVEAAIQVKRAWEALSRESVGLTVSTGGGESLLPETKTEEELKAWAEGRYNGLPERTALAPRTELNEEAKQVVARLDRLADRVRVRAVPDEVQYDDSYFDTWDVCEEEWEELKDDLWRTIEREGVWGILVEIFRKGQWETIDSVWGHVGPIEQADLLPYMQGALEAYDKMIAKRTLKAAKKLARRATYAGPQPDEGDSHARSGLIHP